MFNHALYPVASVSLDAQMTDDDDSGTLLEIIPDNSPSPEALALAEEAAVIVAKALAKLPPRPRYVLAHRYGFCGAERLTFDAIGKRYGLCRERVRQIEEEYNPILFAQVAHLAGKAAAPPRIVRDAPHSAGHKLVCQRCGEAKGHAAFHDRYQQTCRTCISEIRKHANPGTDLCPRCQKRPKKVQPSGRRDTYCGPCRSAMWMRSYHARKARPA